MQVTLTVRHGEAPETVKQTAQEQVEGLAKYFDRLVEADITLDHESHGDRYIAEIRIHTSNDTHFAGAEAGDFRTAVDQTVEKLRRQLVRHKEKLAGRPLSKVDRERLVAASRWAARREDADLPPEWDRITSEEAVIRLHASGEDVLVFVEDGGDVVRIARRTQDGGVDVVDAEAFEIEER